jgi:L-fuculose-phosphate aldolase
MLLEKERIDVVHYGNRMIECGLTTGSGGNVSIFNREKGLIALSPSSMHYRDIKPEDVVVLDLDGNVVEGTRRPSTELGMHLIVYRNRPDVNGVVHTHSIYATAVACMGWDLEPVHYMVAMAGPVVKCSRYATYGTQELAEYALEALGSCGACLLGNHGLLAAAPTVAHAFSTAEHLEYVARLTCITRGLGQPNILTDGQIHVVMDKFGTNPYK